MTPSFRHLAVVLVLALCATLVVLWPRGATALSATCTFERVGDNVELSWDDTGGTNFVRRNGGFAGSAGVGSTVWVDIDAPADATYTLRVRGAVPLTNVPCTEGESPATAGGCFATRVGDNVELRWEDIGGTNILRRNGSYLASAGSGSSLWVDQDAPDDATYLVRIRGAVPLTNVDCSFDSIPPTAAPEPTATPAATPEPTTTPGPPTADDVTERVIHVSIDGLRADYVTPSLMPELVGLFTDGASTLNARTDYSLTRTLPNHTSQLTGRSVWNSRGVAGHRISFNTDRGDTVHDHAGFYIASVFDVVHDNGLGTAIFAGKSKFEFITRSWGEDSGAPDVTGPDDGRNKLDTIVINNDTPTLVADAIDELTGDDAPAYLFLHIRLPDAVGHQSGWLSPQYADAVRESDQLLGQLIAAIDNDPGLASSTSIIVTADHGGPNFGSLHNDETLEDNYTIPFGVWGPEVSPKTDLYELNEGIRFDPGTGRPGTGNTKQPIRAHEVANLALDLLDLPSVPGSRFNADQSLRVSDS